MARMKTKARAKVKVSKVFCHKVFFLYHYKESIFIKYMTEPKRKNVSKIDRVSGFPITSYGIIVFYNDPVLQAPKFLIY